MKKKVKFLISSLLVILLIGFTPIFVKGEEENSSTSLPAIYAGTSNPGKVYKYVGGTTWQEISDDLGFAVLCLVVYEGFLYAGTMSNYPSSGLGRVWRYDGGTTWTMVGQMDNQVCALAVYNGELYAGTAWNKMKLYKYEGGDAWSQVIPSPIWSGTRALYETHGYLLMGDIGYDRFGRWDGINFYADKSGGGCCIYDYQDYTGYVYGSAYYGRLWNSSDAISWSVTLGYDYERGNIWELEEFQNQLFMSYNNGELMAASSPVDRGTTVYTAPDGIISMTTDDNNLYFGTGGEAGASYGSSRTGIAGVYKYDGISDPVLISGEDEFGGGVQVLYISPRSIGKKLSATEGELGDTVHITLGVSIPGGETVTVVDTLPEGFEFIEGTFAIDGIPATPVVEKDKLTCTITTSGIYVLEFDVKIDKANNWEDMDVCNLFTTLWYYNGDLVDEKEDFACFTIHPFEELQKYVGLPKADVVFAIDLSGSMWGQLAYVKTQSINIMNSLAEKIADAKFGLISFIDYMGTYSTTEPGSNPETYTATYGTNSYWNDYPYELDQDITDNKATMALKINGLPFGNGMDWPQDYSRIIHEAWNDTNLHWRDDAEKFLILFGDAQPHDTNFDFNNDGFPDNRGGDPGRDTILGTIDDLDFETEVALAAASGVHIMAVYSGPSAWRFPWEYMASETDGGYYALSSAGDIPDAIIELIEGEIGETLTIKEKTETQWAIVMEVANPFDFIMTDVEITDRFGAEIEIDEPFPSTITHGTVSYSTKGKSEKVFLTWDVGDLLPGETARLILLVSTDLNPEGKQEYTSPGDYELNSGSTLKFKDFEDIQLSAVTNSIYVTVLPSEDP
ncbi:MAG: hypothetical protein ACFFAI_15425 [Promethearchaeota archaeon]